MPATPIAESEELTLPQKLPDALAHGPIAAIIWRLAWPAVVLNSLQVVNTLLDRFFIGHLPDAALTAQGGAINIMFLMFNMALAVATASTALVSRFYGAGEHGQVRTAALQCLRFAMFSGVITAAVTALLAAPAAKSMLPSSNLEAIGLMSRFLIAYGTGIPAVFVIQALAGALRGIGDTKSPMVISGLQILLHMTLNTIFIFPAGKGLIPGLGLGLGLVGAGVALSISSWLSAAGYLVYAQFTPLGSMWSLGLPSDGWARRILNISAPAAVQGILRVGALTAFTVILAKLPNEVAGASAIAGMSMGFAIESIMIMPTFGIAAACASLVGQSLGARRPERAARFGWSSAYQGAAITLALSGIVYFASPWIITGLVDGKANIIRDAVWLLRALCLTEPLFAFAMVILAALQGAGDTRSPMWISVISLWGVRVPLAYVLAFPCGYGAYGAFFAMAVTQGIQAIFAWMAFKGSGWKTQTV